MILQGTHVLITGGTAGIGLSLAQHLQANQAHVTVCGRSAARLEQARTTLGPSANILPCDVADPTQHHDLIERAIAMHGPIDILINNAGIQALMDFGDEGQTRHIATEIAVNLTAPLLLTEALLPRLRQRPNAAVVQVTSGLALSPKASAPVYCATKAGLRAFTRSLRWQLERDKIHLVEVLPPLVDTAMTKGRGEGKLTADAAAAEIVAGLQSNKREIYVGKSKILRFLVALSPWFASLITRRW